MANPHGSFTLHREHRALIARISGSWNLEGYQEFVTALTVAAQPLIHQPWGVIVDIREWGLATPEVDEADHELQLWTWANQQRWRAFVSDEGRIKKHKIEQMADPVNDMIETRFFQSMADARGWFVELGLLHPER